MNLPALGIRKYFGNILESSRVVFFDIMGKGKKNVRRAWINKQEYENNDEPDCKKPKLDTEQEHHKKKKVAMMFMYSGKGYLGMQRNPPYKTIEGDLLDAFVKAGIVRPENIDQPGPKIGFQRAARTDKGVSAAGQVVSFKMFVDVEDILSKINQNLPEQIKVFGWKPVTKGFDSKNACSGRTYMYVTPTFAFAPIGEIVSENYRISKDVLEKLQYILDMFCGTRNFHNYTSGKKPDEASANRYIIDFKVGEPFIRDGIEYIVLTVKGQSFMLHQIRKMTGMTMAVCRGFATIDKIKESWKYAKLDIPKAPGLGLVLQQLHYEGYNRKFGNDGVHVPIDWSDCKEQMDEFKEKYIFSTIYQTEKEEKSMMKWLATLAFHTYGAREEEKPLYDALKLATDDKNKVDSKCNESGGIEKEEAAQNIQPLEQQESKEVKLENSSDTAHLNNEVEEDILENK